MEDVEILLREYDNLWNEKLIHKQSIRKFHNYLTYITAIASLALIFHGVSTTDFFKAGVDPKTATQLLQQAKSIILMFFVPFTPVVLITLTFPINDLFQTYAIGTQIGRIESRINNLRNNSTLLSWEHSVCPVVFGGKSLEQQGSRPEKITNLISAGDNFLLIPSLFFLCIVTTILGFNFLYTKVDMAAAYAYLGVIAYMFVVLIIVGTKLKKYCSADGPLATAISGLSVSDSTPSKPNKATAGNIIQ